MTETVDSVLAEIADGIRVPDKESFTYSLIEDLLEEIVELREDTLLPAHERNHRINTLQALIHNMIAREKFKNRIPRQELKWYPGGSSNSGFLGWGESLEAVLAQDATTLGELGLTAENVGLRLKEILDTSSKTEDFSVETQAWRGFQRCPFDDCSSTSPVIAHASVDFTIVNTRTGE